MWYYLLVRKKFRIGDIHLKQCQKVTSFLDSADAGYVRHYHVKLAYF